MLQRGLPCSQRAVHLGQGALLPYRLGWPLLTLVMLEGDLHVGKFIRTVEVVRWVISVSE